MADFPYLPLWTDAFIADTTHLDATETGAYLMLLMASWRTKDGGLPDDDTILARYARCSKAQWARVRPIIIPMWTKRPDGKFVQKRLERERKYVNDKSNKARAAATAKWLKDNETTNADASPKHMLKSGGADALIPTPTPNHLSESLTGAARGSALNGGSAPRAFASVLADLAAKHRARR